MKKRAFLTLVLIATGILSGCKSKPVRSYYPQPTTPPKKVFLNITVKGDGNVVSNSSICQLKFEEHAQNRVCSYVAACIVDEGARVELRASTSTKDTKFDGWKGSINNSSCADNSYCTININADTTLTAQFSSTIPGMDDIKCLQNTGKILGNEIPKAIEDARKLNNTPMTSGQ